MNTCIKEATVEKSRCKELPGYFLKNLFSTKTGKLSEKICSNSLRYLQALGRPKFAKYSYQGRILFTTSIRHTRHRESKETAKIYNQDIRVLVGETAHPSMAAAHEAGKNHQRHHTPNITTATTSTARKQEQSTRSQQSQPHDRMEGSAAAGGRIAPLGVYPRRLRIAYFSEQKKTANFAA